MKNCKCPKCGHNICKDDMLNDRTIKGKSELGFEIIDYVFQCPECNEILVICPECTGWTYLDIYDDCPVCHGMGMVLSSQIDGEINK